MTALKVGLKVDTFLQGTTILIGLGSLIPSCINDDYSWISLTLLSLLGLIQVLSAIILGLTIKEKKRIRHLGHVLGYWFGYVIILPAGASIAKIIGSAFDLDVELAVVFCFLYIIGVPIVLAIRYFKITLGDMAKVNTLHRSFWDL